MIRRITGRLEGVQELAAELEIEPLAIALEVLVPRYLADTLLARVGETVTLYTRQHLETSNQGASFTPRTIGFDSPESRAFFELLTGVKGLGARKALRAMAEDPARIAALIEAKDPKGLARLPEIGKRTAETIIAELSGKLDAYLDPSSPIAGVVEPKASLSQGPAAEAAEALIALGETRETAERIVQTAIARDPTLTTADADRLLAAAFGARAG